MRLSLRLRMKAGAWLGGLLCVLLACGAARRAPAGPALGYATYLGGGGYDSANALAVDGSGNVWVAGQTVSEDFPVTADAWQKSHGGGGDAFITKFLAIRNPSANSLITIIYTIIICSCRAVEQYEPSSCAPNRRK